MSVIEGVPEAPVPSAGSRSPIADDMLDQLRDHEVFLSKTVWTGRASASTRVDAFRRLRCTRSRDESLQLSRPRLGLQERRRKGSAETASSGRHPNALRGTFRTHPEASRGSACSRRPTATAMGQRPVLGIRPPRTESGASPVQPPHRYVPGQPNRPEDKTRRQAPRWPA